MGKKLAVLLLALTLATGCAGMLEDYVETVSHHVITPYERPPVELDTVSDLDEFEEYLLGLIMSHESQTTIQYVGTGSGNIQENAQAIAQSILESDPVVAYAVSEIAITATRIMAYSELSIAIDYRRTAEQVNSIVEASTQRYMMTQILNIISQYREEAVFITSMQLDKDEITSHIEDLYYQNPRSILMKPYVTVNIFPDTNYIDYGFEQSDADAEGEVYRVYEIGFSYTEDVEVLRDMRDNLILSVRQNAARADGDTDGEILLSIVQNLIVGTVYDEGAASTIAMHGQQRTEATAYGALVRGNAVGEGFAMAFKALCDEMRLDCRVALGYIGERFHAWNIVSLDGNYYHIDTAMCAANGLEAGFLKTDEFLLDNDYTWYMPGTPRCDGPLTLDDLLPEGDTDDYNEDDSPQDITPPANTENHGTTDDTDNHGTPDIPDEPEDIDGDTTGNEED